MEEVYNLSFLCNGKTKQKAEKRGCSHLGCSHTWPKYLTQEYFFDRWKGSFIIIDLFSDVSEGYHIIKSPIHPFNMLWSMYCPQGVVSL